MHTLFDTRRMKHAAHTALKAARPARRHVTRALRHHAARTRALTQQVRDVKPVDSNDTAGGRFHNRRIEFVAQQ